MDRERLDARDPMPADIRAYLEKNGWSFSKKMCEFAVSRMKDRDGKKIEPITKEQIDKLLKTNGIELKHDNDIIIMKMLHKRKCTSPNKPYFTPS